MTALFEERPKSELLDHSRLSDVRTTRNEVGIVVWLTGYSGAGKSTVAERARRRLEQHGDRSVVLDGDELRGSLSADLGFSRHDRGENVRRTAHVAKLFGPEGYTVFVALISPYRDDRDAARGLLEESGVSFIEVHVAAPLEVCRRRDPKGIYKQHGAGQVHNLTGISDPYEPPTAPEIVLSTHQADIETSTSALVSYLDDLRAMELRTRALVEARATIASRSAGPAYSFDPSDEDV